jgi:hypothetical protein
VHEEGGLAWRCQLHKNIRDDDELVKASFMDHSQAVHVLRRLYSNKRSGFAHEEENRSDNLTYGELTVTGMRSLLKASNLTNEDVFTDLGSGTGKLLVYVALR